MAKGKYQYWLTAEGLTLLEGWAREGLTDEQIIEKMIKKRGKFHPSSFYDWKKKYPEISESLKKGKEIVDYEVENTLLKRARGYTYEEEISELKTNPETGEEELTVVKKIRKHMPPDTTAIIFWLKNRRPDIWREKPSGTNDTDKTIKVVFEGEAEEYAG